MSTLWDNIKLKIVMIIHILFVLFVLITPFTNSNYFILMHSIIVPFIMLHWFLNDNTCALTTFEKKLRENVYGVINLEKECFSCKIIEPIYDFKNNYKERAMFIYIVTFVLWFISISKLYRKYKNKEITKFMDFMKM
jgi:hypothetical protein